jgi:hypothetical protein
MGFIGANIAGGGGLGGLLPCGLFPPGRERVGGPHGGGKEDRLHHHRFRVNARTKGATSLPPPCPLFNKRKRGGTPLTPAIGQTCLGPHLAAASCFREVVRTRLPVCRPQGRQPQSLNPNPVLVREPEIVESICS